MKGKYRSNQKLWRISQEASGYWYEIKLAGVVIDRIPIDSITLEYLQKEGVI